MKFKIELNNYSGTVFTMECADDSLYQDVLEDLKNKHDIHIRFDGEEFVIPASSVFLVRRLADESP